MCFSAAASFTVAAACAGAGAFAVAKCPSPQLRPLALMPLGFAAQQAVEGLVWQQVAASSTGIASGTAPAVFMLFATVLWPAYVPFAVRQSETDAGRWRVLDALLVAGGLIALIYITKLLNAVTSAHIEGHSIRYTQQAIHSLPVLSALHAWKIGGLDWLLMPYFAATVGSLALAGLRPVRWFAGFSAAALLLVLIFNRPTLISVWCFFAATGSLMIVLAIYAAGRRAGDAPATSAP